MTSDELEEMEKHEGPDWAERILREEDDDKE